MRAIIPTDPNRTAKIIQLFLIKIINKHLIIKFITISKKIFNNLAIKYEIFYLRYKDNLMCFRFFNKFLLSLFVLYLKKRMIFILDVSGYWWRFPWLKPTKLLNGTVRGVWAWPWTLVGNVFRECHAPCTLKTSFVDLKKEQAHFFP